MLFNGIKKRRSIIVLCVISLMILLVGTISTINGFLQIKAKQIPDSNGDNKELCYLTDEMIKHNTQNYYAIRISVLGKGDPSGVKGHFEKQDKEYTKTKIHSLSGFFVCNAFLGTGNPQKLTIDSTVYSGNLKIVVTDEENNILFQVPIDETYELTMPTQDGKVYYVKLIAESAKLVVSVDRR